MAQFHLDQCSAGRACEKFVGNAEDCAGTKINEEHEMLNGDSVLKEERHRSMSENICKVAQSNLRPFRGEIVAVVLFVSCPSRDLVVPSLVLSVWYHAVPSCILSSLFLVHLGSRV